MPPRQPHPLLLACVDVCECECMCVSKGICYRNMPCFSSMWMYVYVCMCLKSLCYNTIPSVGCCMLPRKLMHAYVFCVCVRTYVYMHLRETHALLLECDDLCIFDMLWQQQQQQEYLYEPSTLSSTYVHRHAYIACMSKGIYICIYIYIYIYTSTCA